MNPPSFPPEPPPAPAEGAAIPPALAADVGGSVLEGGAALDLALPLCCCRAGRGGKLGPWEFLAGGVALLPCCCDEGPEDVLASWLPLSEFCC
jgi:hypothetical protein